MHPHRNASAPKWSEGRWRLTSKPSLLIDRRAVYLSRDTQVRADFVVRRLGDRGANLSSLVERIVRTHLEDYADETEEWRKL